MYLWVYTTSLTQLAKVSVTNPTYNIVNIHMYIQILTTVTPTNIYQYIQHFLRVIRDLVYYVLQLYL
jgi:hypothetical protein